MKENTHFFTRIEKVLSHLAKVVFVAVTIFFLVTHHQEYVLQGRDWLQLAFIAAIIFYRFIAKKALFFIPDEMLIVLPWFWLISVRPYDYSIYPVAFVAIFSVILLCCRHSETIWFKGGLLSNRLFISFVVTFLFYFSFAAILYKVYPAFDCELFRITNVNGMRAFAGIPLSLAAFSSYFMQDS